MCYLSCLLETSWKTDSGLFFLPLILPSYLCVCPVFSFSLHFGNHRFLRNPAWPPLSLLHCARPFPGFQSSSAKCLWNVSELVFLRFRLKDQCCLWGAIEWLLKGFFPQPLITVYCLVLYRMVMPFLLTSFSKKQLLSQGLICTVFVCHHNNFCFTNVTRIKKDRKVRTFLFCQPVVCGCREDWPADIIKDWTDD